MAKTIEHCSEFVFIIVTDMTLARRCAYMAHVKAGIKQDTLSALRQAPLHLTTLFPDQLLKKAEEDKVQQAGLENISSYSQKRKGKYSQCSTRPAKG